jgi:hypothetical protein
MARGARGARGARRAAAAAAAAAFFFTSISNKRLLLSQGV